ncbi:ATP-binding protein [Aliarcobacter butzleri]|uniref:ATP-binding protein n=1 Tax=Aliarcobacter butzleri TaxID=28197 RepID=UPI003B2249B1
MEIKEKDSNKMEDKMQFLKKEVVITEEAIKKLFKVPSIISLSEAIWNAIDAKAKNIHINFIKTQLGAIQEIRITDDGEGIPFNKFEEYFLQYQKSWKREAEGDFHGKNGEGRFKLLAISKNIEWKTIFKIDNNEKEFSIKISKNNPKHFEYSTPEITQEKFRTQVILTQLEDKAKELNSDATFYNLIAIFALQLKKRNDLKIFLNGNELIPDSFIFEESLGVLEFKTENESFNINYIFIAWKDEFKFNDSKHTYFFDENGNYIIEKPSGIQGNFVKHSVFLKSNYFKTFDGFNEELQNNVGKIRDLYKKQLFEFLLKIRQQQAKKIYNDFTTKNYYPFEQKNNKESLEEKALKEIYDLCAFKILEEDPKLLIKKEHSIQLVFKLLKKIVEKEENVGKIISEVLELDETASSKFVNLLDSTPLPSIITYLDEVVRKLAFLDILEEIVHDEKYKKKLKERSQLHKIIEKETWIFGNEFENKVGTSDKGFSEVIKQHMKINDLSEKEIEQIIYDFNVDKKEDHLKRLIPDLYLWHDYKLNGNTEVKNLIVELKAPKVKISYEEIEQIQKQRRGIQQNTRYSVTNSNKWIFYVISSEINPTIIKDELKGENNDILYEDENKNFIVYCKTWDELIRKAKLSLNKQKEELQIQIKKSKHEELLQQYLNQVDFRN